MATRGREVLQLRNLGAKILITDLRGLGGAVRAAGRALTLPWFRTTGCPASISTLRSGFEGDRYETLAICRNVAIARAAFNAAIAKKPAGRLMIRSRIRVVKRHPEGDR